MSSVHLNPAIGPNWVCHYRDRTGRRRCKSTRTTVKREAIRLCNEIQALEDKAKAGNLSISNARRVIEDKVAEIMETQGTPLPKATVREFLTQWLTKKTTKGSASATVSRYKTSVAGLLSHLGAKAGKSLSSLTAADVESFHAARLKAGLSPTTANLDVKILRSALHAARKEGLVASNVIEAVELPESRSVVRDVFTVGEVQRLLAAAAGEWRTLITLAFYTGARLGDCVTMRRANWDKEAGVLRFRQRKTGWDVVMPVHPVLAAHLEALDDATDEEGHFLPGMAGAKSSGAHGLSESFKRIMGRAGVGMAHAEGEGKRSVARKSFHSFRHGFTSLLANAGVAPEIRKKLVGHHDKSDIHARYSHHEIQVLRDAISKLPSLT